MCKNPNCPSEESRCRGLCFNCYQMAASLVRHKKTTWAALTAKGKCNPAERKAGAPRSKRGDWFADAIDKD